MVNEDIKNFHYQAFFSLPNTNIDEYLQKIRLRNHKHVNLQLVDPSFIVSRKHIEIAIYHTQKNFKQGNNIAKDKSTEFLLRISGKKQISSALELFGIKENSKIVLLIAFGGSSSQNIEAVNSCINEINIPDDKLVEIEFPLLSKLELSKHYQCTMDIDDLEKCVFERIAMLAVL